MRFVDNSLSTPGETTHSATPGESSGKRAIFLFLKSKVITLHDARVGGTVPFIIL